MTRRPWTPTDLAVLRAMYPTASADEIAKALGRGIKSVYTQAHVQGLRKPVEWIAERARERSQRPDHGGVGHRFTSGMQPWNKGVPGSTGLQPGCRATQFKAGRPAHDARNYRPIGTLRINAAGVLERKVTDDPGLVPARRWVGVHRLVWEAEHGPVPDGHAVVFRPGRRTTDPDEITLDALELITRAELMARNSVHRLPREVAQAVQLLGAVRRQINRRKDATA